MLKIQATHSGAVVEPVSDGLNRPPVLARAVSVEDGAAMLGIGRTTMFGLVRSGEVGTVTIGRRRLVPVADIDAYLDRLRAASAEG
jgi:excisionase family DNA binding protein